MRISLRTGLSIGIVAIVALTAALIHFPWQATSRDNVEDLDMHINALASDSIGSKIAGLLDTAAAARTAIAGNIESGATDIGDRAKVEALFLALLQSQPRLTAIEFGDGNDRSFRVRRAVGGTIRVEDTTAPGDTANVNSRVYHAGNDGVLTLLKEENGTGDYLVTQQFWYKSAFTQDSPVWSNIYPLPASRAFGVTSAQTIERDGKVLGVLGVSISLDALSDFLDGVTVGRAGSVFLTNTAGQLVAAPKIMAVAPPDGRGPLKLPSLDETKVPAVQVVAAALKAGSISLADLRQPRQVEFRDPGDGRSYFVMLAPLERMGLVVSVVLPAAELTGSIDRNTHRLMIGLAVFIVLVAIGATIAARALVGIPLAKVTANLRQLEDFRFDRIVTARSIFTEIGEVAGATARMATSLSSFRKYIPTELVRVLFAQGIEAKLGGELKTLTILFMDLAGFTQISERLGDRLVAVLGDYLSAMSNEIQAERGTIDKYIGDAIMAFWGAPVPSDDHALAACRAALACQARLAAMRAANPNGELGAMRARIGINTGRVLVGNVGSHDRINYSAIGDPVNVASRLESLNKVYGTEIMIGAPTMEAVGARLLVRRLDTVAVYGREGGLAVYELLGLRDISHDAPDWVAAYEAGLAALLERDWEGAIALFRRTIAMRGGADGPSSAQIARALAFKADPPPPNWDGLVVMNSK